MTNRQGALRLFLWIAWFIASLALIVIATSKAPHPVGTKALHIAGWGAGVGLIISLAVHYLYWPVRGFRGKLRGTLLVLNALFFGGMGGASGAQLIDRHQVAKGPLLELPVLEVATRERRRRSDLIQITTLEPLNPPHTWRISLRSPAELEIRSLRPGMCIELQLEKGQLGSVWGGDVAAVSCSSRRGTPSTHVIAFEDFSSWRWHTPRLVRENDGPVFDDALPAGVACRIRPDSPLYRCSPLSAAVSR